MFATLLMIVVTLIAGAAVLGWVNGQAGSSERAYGNSAANNINNLNERFSAESQVFSTAAGAACNGPNGASGTGPGCTSVSFYLYNNGAMTFTLRSIQIVSTSLNPNPLNIVFYTACQSSGNCPSPAGTETATQPVSCNPTPVYVSNAQYSASPPTGFYVVTPPSTYGVAPGLPENYLSTTTGGVTYGPYWLTLPSCSSGQLYMYDNSAYTITFTGLYGNTVQETLTANG